METLLLERRNVHPRKRGKEAAYHWDVEHEDPLLSIGSALLFRSAFGRTHSRLNRVVASELESTDYGAIRSKKHLKCRQ
jgi:hypothetical protein